MTQTIIHSVLLFDGHNTYPNATVTFDPASGLITSVSHSSDSSSFPSQATIIDGTGHTLIPGLIDGHMHCHQPELPSGSEYYTLLKAPLKCGVTTLCDLHSDPESVNSCWDATAKEVTEARKNGGKVSMSDLKSSLFAATIEGGWPAPPVLHGHPSEVVKKYVSSWPNVTVETAADFVKTQKAGGAHYIKLMQDNCCLVAMPTNSIPSATLELQTAVVDAARKEGMLVIGHAFDVGNTEIILKSGADGLSHTFCDQEPPKHIIDLYKKTGAFVIPTLATQVSLAAVEQQRREKFAEIAFKKGIIDEAGKAQMLDTMSFADPQVDVKYAYQSIIALKAEGIDVIAGTDASAGLKGTAVGPSLWQELEMYIDFCGFTAMDALKSATSTSARRFRFDDRGVIAEGKRADLVLVKGDVTQNLHHLWEGDGIAGVWKVGLRSVTF